MTRREYRCQIEIDVDADCPTDAAVQAWELLRAAECIPWVVGVRTNDDGQLGPELLIDLERVLGSE